MQLGQAVDRLGEQLRSRVGLVVKILIGRRVAETKIRAEVDHPLPGAVEWNSELGGETMRQREEEKLGPALEQGVDRGFGENQF